jgi:hypothetical protein
MHGSEPRGSNPYSREPRGENPYGAGPANGRARTGGHADAARDPATRTPTDIRDEVRRLIDARNPEAALLVVVSYLQEADRILAEAAHQFSEARSVADHADRDHVKVAAERKHLARELRELERERKDLEVRARMLDHAFESLAAREAAVEALECELQKKTRRRVVEAPPALEFFDTPSLQLRPDPSRTRSPVEFMGCLADFRVWRGNRSYRHIAEASGNRISASTVGNILRGGGLPDRMDVIDAFVIGCGGNDDDRREFACAWQRLYMTDNTITDMPRLRPEME